RPVISELSVLNQWRGFLLPSKHFLISLSYTNGQSVVMEINNKLPVVLLNGQEFLTGISPIMVDSRMLVPMRQVFDAVGITVHWDNQTKSGLAVKDGRQVSFSIDSTEIKINGQTGALPLSPRLVNNQTYIPISLLRDGFGLTVLWDGANRTADIKTN
ncbi:MAG: stalk domain-containing protein, partial [Bacillota bacterium]|nr:stalk domain-containing protein [Bacillota bacterium]